MFKVLVRLKQTCERVLLSYFQPRSASPLLTKDVEEGKKQSHADALLVTKKGSSSNGLDFSFLLTICSKGQSHWSQACNCAKNRHLS